LCNNKSINKYGKLKKKGHLSENNAGNTEKMADINNINFPPFTPSWFSLAASSKSNSIHNPPASCLSFET
jgi:hypothetical protein